MTDTEVASLHLLQLGSATVHVPTFMPMEPERGEVYTGPVAAYLVNGRLRVLVDTGLSPIHLVNPQARVWDGEMAIQMRAKDTITRRLRELELEPRDIDALVMTHLDFDHCGGNRFFPRKPIYIQQEHLDFARVHPERCYPDDWDHPGLDYDVVDGDVEIFPGLELVTTPGHVPGHQSVIVRLPSQTIILVGDAALTHVMYDEERVQGTYDPEASRTSIRTLKEIQKRERAHIIIGHDADAWRSYRVAPQFYS